MTYMGLCSNNTPCPLIYDTPTLYNYKGTFTQVEEAAQSFQYYIKYYWTEIMNNSNIKYLVHFYHISTKSQISLNVRKVELNHWAAKPPKV